MSQRIKWMLVGSIAAVLMGGAGAFATTQLLGSGETISACAQKQTGQLRLSADGSCGPAEVAVSWNERGPAGPPGPPGAATLDDFVGTPCTLGAHTGTTYLFKGDGVTNFTIGNFVCMMPDGSEPNDTQQAAATLSVPTATQFRTLYPAGDDDWYSLPHQALSGLGVFLDRLSDGPFTADLYRDGTLVKSAGTTYLQWSAWADGGGDMSPHDWLLHVSSPAVQMYSLQVN